MRKFLLALIILTFALTACGGGSAATTGNDANLPAPEGANDVAEPTVEDTTAEPTEAEPTEVVMYTGSCANKYFPIQEGLTLSYVFKSPDQPNVEMLVSFSDITDDGFTMTQTLNDKLTLDTRWECTDEGLTATEYNSFQFAAAGYELTTTGQSGVKLPLEDQMLTDNAWSNQFEVQALFSNESGSGEAALLITESSLGLGFISVSVPAGTYEDTFQVETETNYEITTLAEGEATGTVSLTNTTTTWYAEGVGIVKQETASQGILTTLELLEILH